VFKPKLVQKDSKSPIPENPKASFPICEEECLVYVYYSKREGGHQDENPHEEVEDPGQNTSQEVIVPAFLNKVGMEEVDP